MTRVLLITKSDPVGVERHLKRAGMTVDMLDCGDELELAQLDYDAIVFHLALCGFELIRRLRQARCHVPIIALIGIDDYKIRVAALNAGADDALLMPFFGSELVARIRAVTRRAVFGHADNVITVGRMTVYLDRQLVEIDGCPTEALSTKQFQLLAALCQSKGRLLSKSHLLLHLYGCEDDEPEPKIIDVMLAQIRKRLGPVSREYLRTVHGTGHCIDDSPPRVRLAQRLTLARATNPTGRAAPVAA